MPLSQHLAVDVWLAFQEWLYLQQASGFRTAHNGRTVGANDAVLGRRERTRQLYRIIWPAIYIAGQVGLVGIGYGQTGEGLQLPLHVGRSPQ